MNGVKWIVLLSILWVDQKAKQRFLALVEQNEVTNGQLDWIKNNFFSNCSEFPRIKYQSLQRKSVEQPTICT